PSVFEALIAKVRSGVDVVVASRYLTSSSVTGVTDFRKLSSYCANKFFSIFFPIAGIRDYTSGYRALSGRCLLKLYDEYGPGIFQFPKYNFICTSEILYKFTAVAKRFEEVPIVLNYEQKETESKASTFKLALGVVFLSWHLILNGLPNMEGEC
ncbi:hypothetical protein BVY02_02465, partial [bacterium J17]